MAKKPKAKKLNIDLSDITYHKGIISCACGAEYDAGSTVKDIRVDICAACHPFFTGDNRIIDTEGRVEKFRKKYNLKSS